MGWKREAIGLKHLAAFMIVVGGEDTRRTEGRSKKGNALEEKVTVSSECVFQQIDRQS